MTWETPSCVRKETEYCSVDDERDPSLATFAKASVAEALGIPEWSAAK
jgi:hypothetical protein